MKRFHLVTLVLFIGLKAFALSNNDVWTFRGGPTSIVKTFKQGSDVFVISATSNALFVNKLKASDGAVVWSKTLLTTTGAMSIVTAKADSLFNFYLVGSVVSTSGLLDALVLKSDSSGNLQFYNVYNGRGNLNDRYNDVDIDNQLNIYVVGETNANLMGTDPLNPYVIDRGLLYSPIYYPFNYPYKPDVTSNGTTYLNSKILVSALGQNGSTLWNTTLAGTYSLNAFGSKIKANSSGELYVASVACNERDSIVYFQTRYIMGGGGTTVTEKLFKNYFFWAPMVNKLNAVNGSPQWEYHPVYNTSNNRFPWLGSLSYGSRPEGIYNNVIRESILGLELDSAKNILLFSDYKRYQSIVGSNTISLNNNYVRLIRITPSNIIAKTTDLDLGSYNYLKSFDYKVKNKSILMAYGTYSSSTQDNWGRVARFDMNLVNKWASSPSDIGPGSNFSQTVAVDADSTGLVTLAYTYQTLASWYPYGVFVNQYLNNGTFLRTVNLRKSVSSKVNSIISDNNGSLYIDGLLSGILARFCLSDIQPLPVSQSICKGESISIVSTSTGVVSYVWTPSSGVSNPNSGVTTLAPLSTTSFTQTVTFRDGCVKSSSLNVAIRASMAKVNLRKDTTICSRDSLYLNVGMAYPKITWSSGATIPGIWAKSTVGIQKIKVSVIDSCNILSSDSISINFLDCRTPLLVRALNSSKTYGKPNPNFTGTISGLLLGDAINVTYTLSGLNIVPIVTGSALSKYILTTVAGTFTIIKAPLTVTAFNVSKTYGQPNPTFTGTVAGLVSGDVVNVSYSLNGTSIVPFVSGTALSNYSLTTVPGVLTISKAPLTVTAFNASKTYGQPNPTFTGTVAGLVSGDVVNVSYSLNGTSIVPIVSGAALSNYSLTTVPGVLTISKAPLTVTAFNASKTYGQPNPTFTGTVAGLVSGDVVNVSYSLNGTSIVPIVSGAELSNYSLTTVPGVLTISRAPLTVTAFNASKTYGQPDPNFTGTVTGLVSGDVVNVSYSLTGTSIVPVVSGAALSNYSLTTVSGVLTILKAQQTITGFVSLPTLTVGGGNYVSNLPVASSGLPISYTSSDLSIVSISGNLFIPISQGTVTITAWQIGDDNFFPAIEQNIILNVVANLLTSVDHTVQNESSSMLVFPNPTSGDFTVTSIENSKYQIINLDGEIVQNGVIQVGKNFIQTQLTNGEYLIKTEKSTVKIVVE